MKKMYVAPVVSVSVIEVESMLLSSSVAIDTDTKIDDTNVENFEIQ